MITCSLSTEQIERLARTIAFRVKAASQNADIESFTPDLIIRGIYDDVFKSTNNPAQALDYARVTAILLDKGYGRANATIKENLKAKNSNRTEIEAISIAAEKEGGLEYIKNYLGFVKPEGELSKKQQEEIEEIDTKGTVVTINFNRTKPETPLATTIQEYDEANKVEKADIVFYTAFVKDILKNRLTNRVDGKENGGIDYPGVPGGIYLSMVKLERIPVEQRHSSTSSDYVYVITDSNGNFIQFDNNYNVGSGKIIYFNARPVPALKEDGTFNLYQSPYVQTPEEIATNTKVSVEEVIESLNKQYAALSNAQKYLDKNSDDFILYGITDGSFGQVILEEKPTTPFSNINIVGNETIEYVSGKEDKPDGYYIFFPGAGVQTNAQSRKIDEATAKMIADLLFNRIILDGKVAGYDAIKDVIGQYVAFSKNKFSVNVSSSGFQIKYKGELINTKEGVIAALKELYRKVDPKAFNADELNLGYLQEGSNELKFRKLTKKEYLNEIYSGTKVVVNNKGEIITRNPYFITTIATSNVDKILPEELRGKATTQPIAEPVGEVKEGVAELAALEEAESQAGVSKQEEFKKNLDVLLNNSLDALAKANSKGIKFILGFHGGRRFEKPDRTKQYTGEFRSPDARRIAESMGSRYEGQMLFFTDEQGDDLFNYDNAIESAAYYALQYGDDTPTVYAYLIPIEEADFTDRGVGEVALSYDAIEKGKYEEVGRVSFDRVLETSIGLTSEQITKNRNAAMTAAENSAKAFESAGNAKKAVNIRKDMEMMQVSDGFIGSVVPETKSSYSSATELYKAGWGASANNDFTGMKTVMISGSGLWNPAEKGGKITKSNVVDHFNNFYKPLIDKAISQGVTTFNLGVASGMDSVVSDYLKGLGYVATSNGKWNSFSKPEVKTESPVVEQGRQDSASTSTQSSSDNPIASSVVDSELLAKILNRHKDKLDKQTTVQATIKQIQEAKAWYEKSPLSKHIPFTVMFNVINSKTPGSIATWTVHGITLFKGSDYSDLYHEAWHGFTQMFMTQEQRDELYAEARKQSGTFKSFKDREVSYSNATVEELEEKLAEDFREFMLGKKKPTTSTPVKKNFFQKILDMLLALFGNSTVKDIVTEGRDNPLINDLYNKLRVGNLAGYTFNQANAEFSLLNSNRNWAETAKPADSDIYYDPSNKTVSRGSRVMYKGNEYILWNIKSDNKVQLIDPVTFKKFSGTPDVSKIESVLGKYNSITHSNKIDYIVADNNIISLSTGDIVFQGEKDPQRQQILDRFKESVNVLPDNVPSTISREDANFLSDSANGLISEFVDYLNASNSTNVFTSSILIDPQLRGMAYDYVKLKFEQSLKDLLAKKAAVNPDEYIGEYDNDIAMLTYAIDYFGDSKNLLSPKGFIRYNIETSEYVSLVQDPSIGEEIDELNPNVKNEFEARSGNETSTQNLASSSFLNTVNSLLAVDKDGKVERNRLGFPQTANFTKSWNRIVNVTEGASTIEEIIQKLESVKDDYPVIAQFLSKIGSPNTTDGATVRLWTDINKILTMPRINLVSLKFKVKKANDVITALITPTEAMGEFTKVGKLWDNAFISSYPSKYIIRDAKNINYLDADAVLKDFKGLTEENAIDFMIAIGMPLDKNKVIQKAIMDPQKGIYKFIQQVYATLSHINQYNKSTYSNNENLSEDKKIIIRKPSDILASYSNKVADKVYVNGELFDTKKNLSGFSNDYKEIQRFALLWSDDFSDTTVSNAEGENQYERSLRSTASNQVAKINSAKSLIELTQEGVNNPTDLSMNHLSKSRNPFMKGSRLMRRLFDRNGNKITKAPDRYNKRERVAGIRMINMSGLSKELQEIKKFVIDGITDEKERTLFSGIASASADGESKKIQDFYMLMLYGAAEATRNADKSTTYLYKVEDATGEKHYINLKEFIRLDQNGQIVIPSGRSQTITIFIDYISNEYERIQKLLDGDPAGNVTVGKKTYREVGADFVIFKDVLKELAGKIKSIEGVKTSEDFIKYLDNNLELREQVTSKINQYLNRKETEFLKSLNDINFFEFNSLLEPILKQYGITKEKYEGLSPEKKKEVQRHIAASYIANDWISRYEVTTVFQGDPALYDHSKDEFFKRNAGFASTGEFPRIDQYMINYVNKKLSANSLAAKKGYPAKRFGRTMSTAVLQDKVTTSKYYDDYVKAAKEKEEKRLKKLNLSEEEIKKELLIIEEVFKETYADMKEGDGQGWINFDAYRNLLTSLNLWSAEQEKLYIDIINGVDVSVKDINQFFPVKKFQYWGQLDTAGLPVIGFHKFSLMPLIPNMLKPGTGLAILQDKMLQQGIDYALLQSGSKINTVTKNGKVDKFYNDNKNYQDRTVAFTDPKFEFTKNEIFLDYLKDQVSVSDVYKGKNTFSTQLRKLIEQGLYEYGVPTDWRPKLTDDNERVNEWAKATDESKETSDHYNKVKRYETALNKLVDIKKEKLKSEIGKDKKSLIEFIKKELTRQEVADHVEDFIDFDPVKNDFKRPLELSLSIEDIERLLVGIIQKRIINLKVTGESLVQVSGIGFEQSALRSDQTDVMFDEGTNGLKFYRQDPVTKKTLPMQVKISMQGPFKKLLELPDVKERSSRLNISRLEALNQLLADEAWMSSNENRKLVTLVSVRIPVQGLNSMEFMEVVEFFPETSGNLIVLPAEIVAKSGGDFDIDKMFTMFPNIESKLDFDIEANVKQVSGFVGKTLTKKEILDAKKKQNKFEDTGKDERTDVDKKIIEALENIDFDNMTVGLTTGEGTKGVENEVLDSIKEILEIENNFVNLITPNTTYDLKNLATQMAEKLRGETKEAPSATKIFEIERNLYKHQSNNIGKVILGIIAVNNTFNSVFSRTGLILEPARIITTRVNGLKVSHPQILELPHNKIGSQIALSGLYSANGIKKISDIISQMINGSVDVAKDAWIFDIQGNKEIIGALMFMIQAGVPADTAVYFVSQPLIQDYIKRQKEYKSKIHDVLGRADVGMFWRKRALEDILEDNSEVFTDVKDQMGAFSKEKYFSKFRELAASGRKNNLFTNDSLIKNIENKDKFTDVDFAALSHFIEIEEMAKQMTQITQNLNFDTTKTSNMFDARHKLAMLDEIENGISKKFIESVLKESPIGAFKIQEFIAEIYKDVFKVRDNEEFVEHIFSLLIGIEGVPPQINNIRKETELETDEFVRRYRNDIMSYIFQNSFYAFDSEAKTYSSKEVSYKVQPVLSLSYRSGVAIKDNTLYVDKTTLKNSFYTKDKASSWSQGVAPVPDYMFDSQYYNSNTAYELYVKFVYERETLRTLADYSFDALSKTEEFKEYYKDLMSVASTSEKEADAKAYELVLRDAALENVGVFGAMFLGQNSYSSKIAKLLTNKELVSKYEVLNLLSPATVLTGGVPMTNLFLKGRLSKEQIDTAHRNLIDLSNPSVKKVEDPEENLRISKLFKKFALFTLLQSGVDTRSTFSMIKIIPNDDYLALMEKPYNDFLEMSGIEKRTYFENYNQAFLQQYNIGNKFLSNRFKNYAKNVSTKDIAALGLVKQKVTSLPSAFEGSINSELQQTENIEDQKSVVTDLLDINGVKIDLNTLGIGFQPNAQQIEALKKMADFVDKEFSETPDDNIYTLMGYAGTGKSSITKILLEYIKQSGLRANVTAPTHRAKKIIKELTGKKARTIHKELGLKPDQDLEKLNLSNLKFALAGTIKETPPDILIIDEASFINDGLLDSIKEILMSKNYKVIFIGDPAQLRPVNQKTNSKVFDVANKSELTKVERQQDGNPLGPILDAIRSNLSSPVDKFQPISTINGDQGVVFTTDSGKFLEQAAQAFLSKNFKNNRNYVRVVTYTNERVESINRFVRKAMGYTQEYVQGEILMSYDNLRSNYRTGDYNISNSADYQITSRPYEKTILYGEEFVSDGFEPVEVRGYSFEIEDINDPGSTQKIFIIARDTPQEALDRIATLVDGVAKKAAQEKKETGEAILWQKYYALKDNVTFPMDIFSKDVDPSTGKKRLIVKKTFDYGYAHTIHKSQGGTYTHIFADFDSVNGSKLSSEEKNQLKYVALSRATNIGYVFNNKAAGAVRPINWDMALAEKKVKIKPRTVVKGTATPSESNDLDKFFSVFQSTVNGVFTFEWNGISEKRKVQDAEVNVFVPKKNALSEEKVQLFKVNYPKSLIVYNEAIDRSDVNISGTNSVYRSLEDASYGIRTKIGIKPTSPGNNTLNLLAALTDETYAENIKMIDEDIQAMLNKQAEGFSLIFDNHGYGQYMIGYYDYPGTTTQAKIVGDPIAPETFNYLSEQLFEKFGYINPNWLKTEKGRAAVQKTQNVTDAETLEQLKKCRRK